ncbi:MAG TPA: hypothetical protein GX526_07005 [Thermoanaerobacterales bacterium]|nr:hypothetical protein [Thermoanaerobacterales bacterium]
MVSPHQLQSVAQSCPEYTYIGSLRNDLSALFDENQDISCDTCIHWEGGKCNIDIYDDILTSLDQT